jgi:hypothetical protein
VKNSHGHYNERKGIGGKRLILMERRGSSLRNIIETYDLKKNYKEELMP